MTKTKLSILLLSISIVTTIAQTPNTYDLWMGYSKIEDGEILKSYREATSSIYFQKNSDILEVTYSELSKGLKW